MSLFVHHYNMYMKKHRLKHFEKTINFIKSNQSKRWKDNKKYDKESTCFEYGKPGQF